MSPQRVFFVVVTPYDVVLLIIFVLCFISVMGTGTKNENESLNLFEYKKKMM